MKTIRDLLADRVAGTLASVGESATVYEGLELLARGNYGALPVVRGEELVGIFSERDYARKVALSDKSSRTTLISEVMTANPFCVSPESTLEEAMRLMTEKGFRHLPVVADKKLVHMISIKDAVRAVIDDREALLETVVTLGAQKQQERERAIQRLATTFKAGVEPLQREIEKLLLEVQGPVEARVRDLSVTVQGMAVVMESILDVSQPGRKLQNSKVLLATDNRAEEVIAKLALGGTGVELETVSSLESGLELLKSKTFDIVCVNGAMIDLAYAAREKNKAIKVVFMTSEEAESYVARLKQHPFLSNVMSQSEHDRTFTVRSILSTVSKLITQDYFGMEKYLNWGAEIREHSVERSADRGRLIEQMEEFLRGLGIRKLLIDRCRNSAEELLMNAIYDAPVSADGKRLYNHLDRTVAVELKPAEQAVFRYGCDGLFLGISVRDPFGSLDRETILDYIESCFSGVESKLHQHKGGGGHGLFILFRSAHLTVFNVQHGRATEVIVLFDLDPKPTAGQKKSSFHYFES